MGGFDAGFNYNANLPNFKSLYNYSREYKRSHNKSIK